MKVAIIGSNGFLGRYLTKSLSEKYTVLPVTRQTMDISDYDSVQTWLKESRPHVVVNCAISGGGTALDDINYSHVQHDLRVFLNFYNSDYLMRYINIGSGAEFDRRTNINNMQEQEIVNAKPLESYSFVKNTIARMCKDRTNFFTLRLFGCFDSSEPDFRLFKKFKTNGHIDIQDKYFDFISAYDFATIVDYYIKNTGPYDMNCVYPQKLLLSEQLRTFAKFHVPHGTISSKLTQGLNYTGDGSRLQRLNLPLLGLEESIRRYE